MLSLVKGKAVEELGAKPVEVSRLKISENVPAPLDGTRRQTQRLVITIVPVCPWLWCNPAMRGCFGCN